MNKNVESHFSRIPAADIQRSVFDRSFSVKTSFNTGELIPILCEEILPGDTVKLSTSKVVRMQTLLTPILDNIYAETFYFFVPNRLVWKHWKEFCGENSESAWIPSTVYTEPKISSPNGGFNVGTVADYLGLPIGVEWSDQDELCPSALPFRAYALICNEWFRDENLKDPLLIPDGDGYQQGSNGSNYITDIANGGKPFKAAKFHDYFTSALPDPQRGDPVRIAIAGAEPYPVRSFASNFTRDQLFPSQLMTPARLAKSVGVSGDQPVPGSPLGYVAAGSGTTVGRVQNDDLASDGSPLYFVNLGIDLKDAPAITVNDLRLAFATQRYLEKLAYGGARYTSVLRTLFGITADDASLQRPEYLGGSRINLNVSEVTNNAQTENEYLGDLGGMSSTADSHYDFVKSFSEHGWLIGVVCCRYKHTYCQGIPKKFLRTNFLDYYQPTFANLGNMPIYSAEIYADGNTDSGRSKVFGYQEAWAEYRYGNDICTGEMRPDAPQSLASWHLADDYDQSPTLSSDWIDEDLNNVNRVLAVSSNLANQIFGDFYFELEHTRPMPMYSIPGLIDHF